MPGVMNVVAARRAVPCARGEREGWGPLPEEGEEIRRWWLLVSRGPEETVPKKGSKRRRAMKMRYGLSAVLMLFMAVQLARADEAAPAVGATPAPTASSAAAGPADASRKKIAKQLAECAGCPAASKKAEERASSAPDKIGAAQCDACKGYWAANANVKNGGLHYSKDCQSCARMEAAGRDGACDACQKMHDARKREKRDKN